LDGNLFRVIGGIAHHMNALAGALTEFKAALVEQVCALVPIVPTGANIDHDPLWVPQPVAVLSRRSDTAHLLQPLPDVLRSAAFEKHIVAFRQEFCQHGNSSHSSRSLAFTG